MGRLVAVVYYASDVVGKSCLDYSVCDDAVKAVAELIRLARSLGVSVVDVCLEVGGVKDFKFDCSAFYVHVFV